MARKRSGFSARFRRRPRLPEAEIPLVYESDARPVAGHPRRLEDDPDAERRFRRRRRAFRVLLGAIFTLGSVAALLGEGGVEDRLRLRYEHRTLSSRVEQHRQATERLRQEVEALRSDPHARERIAREELGYARPGEIVFLLPR